MEQLQSAVCVHGKHGHFTHIPLYVQFEHDGDMKEEFLFSALSLTNNKV